MDNTNYTTDFAIDFDSLAEQCALVEAQAELDGFVSLLDSNNGEA